MQSPPDPPLDAKTILFRWGLQTVMAMTGRPEKPVRTWIGLLLKALGDDAAALNKILQEAVERRPIDPTAWVSKAVKQRASQTGGPGKPEAFGHMPETPGSIFVRRYRAGEIDADGNELKPASSAAGNSQEKPLKEKPHEQHCHTG